MTHEREAHRPSAVVEEVVREDLVREHEHVGLGQVQADESELGPERERCVGGHGLFRVERFERAVRAFKQGMAPIVIALIIATGWLLASSQGDMVVHWRAWLLTAISALLVWKTRLHLLWLLGAGALAGALGWV